MGVLTKVNILTRHVQVTGLVRKLNIPLPSFFLNCVAFSDILNFDWSFFNLVFPDLPHLTFQIQFIAGCVVLPLAVMLITLVAFLDYFYIEWMLGVAMAAFILIASLTRHLDGVQEVLNWGNGMASEGGGAFAGATNPYGTMGNVAVGAAKDNIKGGEAESIESLGLWVVTAIILLGVSLQSILCRFILPKYLGEKARASASNHNLLDFYSSPTIAVLRAFSFTLEPVALTCGLIIAGLPKTFVFVVMTLGGVYFILIFRSMLNEHVSSNEQNAGMLGAIFIFVAGIIVAVWVLVDIDPPSEVREGIYPFGYLQAGASLLGILLHILEVKSEKFVKMRSKLQGISDRGFLTACFFFICSAMVPVVTNCLQMFMCVDYDCPVGTRFNPFVTFVAEESGTAGDAVSTGGVPSQDRFCDPCTFNHNPNIQSAFDDPLGGDQLRNVCPFASTDLCPAWTDKRLLQHPDTSCSDGQSYPLLIATACVSLFVFGFIINTMFYKLTRDITNELTQNTKVRHTELRKEYAQLRKAFEDKEFVETARKFAAEAREIRAEREMAAVAAARRQHKNNNNVGGRGGGGIVEDLDMGDEVSRQRGRRRDSNERMLLGSSESEEFDDDDVLGLNPRGKSRKRGGNGGGIEMQPLAHSPPPSPIAPSPEKGLLDMGATRLANSDDAASSSAPTGGAAARLSTAGGGGDANKSAGYDPAMLKVASAMDKPPDHPPSYEDAFADVCARITPKASSLYSPYRFPLRYFLLIDNLHRLLLVLSTVVLARLDGVGVSFNLVAHLLMFSFQLILRPFHDQWEQLLSLVASCCDLLCALYVMCLYLKPDSSFLLAEGTAIVVVIVTIVIPFVAAIVLFGIGMYTSWNNPYLLAEREKLKAEKKARKAAEAKRKKQIEDEKAFQKALGKKVEKRPSLVPDASTGSASATDGIDANQLKTERIDADTKRTLGGFLGSSVPALVSTAVLGIIAIMRNAQNVSEVGFVLGSDAFFRDQVHVLGGRFDWEDFTQHCCCFESNVPMDGYNVTERWVCSNLPRLAKENASSTPFADLAAQNSSSSSGTYPPFNYSHVMDRLSTTNGSLAELFRASTNFKIGPTLTVTRNRRVKGFDAVKSSKFVRFKTLPTDADNGIPLRSVCGNRLRYPLNCSVVLDNTNNTVYSRRAVVEGSEDVILECTPSNFMGAEPTSSSSGNNNAYVSDAAKFVLW